VCVGFHPSPPIHPKNKHLAHHHLGSGWLEEKKTAVIHFVVFGDSLGDSKVLDQLASKYKSCLKIGFFNASKHWQSLEDFKECYDIVLPHTADFHWLCDLLHKHARSL